VVSRMRGQQLKEPAQLDGWLRDGSADFVTGLCDFSGRAADQVLDGSGQKAGG